MPEARVLNLLDEGLLARLVPRLAEAGDLGVPVLTSPHLAVEQLRARIHAVGAAH